MYTETTYNKKETLTGQFCGQMFCLYVAVFVFATLLPLTTFAQSPITGWAWSDGTGWISLNCSNLGTCATINYGLTKNADGTITGYAWSDYVGWISAMSADISGCPVGACTPSISSNGVVSGWLKVLHAQNGWDGWVSLRGTGYGADHYSSGALSGWAWGDAVVGWILFSADQPCATTAGNFCDGNAWKKRSPNCTVTTIIADCGPSGCSPVTNQCVSTPPPTSTLSGGQILRATPSLVSRGGTSTISWDVINATSCSVTGNGDSWSGTTNSQTTSPILVPSMYSLTCTGLGGSLAGTAWIRIPPRMREF